VCIAVCVAACVAVCVVACVAMCVAVMTMCVVKLLCYVHHHVLQSLKSHFW